MRASSERFPTTLLAAVRYFEDEAVCRDFLAGLRWPNGVICPFCGSEKVGHIATRSLWRCKDCRKQFSVKKGTIFEDSPIPLSKWLPAIWLYSAGKKGRSSHQLARDLGVTQKTAWFMSHRIRLAMETDGFDAPLSGEVEVDETIMGGHDQNKHACTSARHLGQAGRQGRGHGPLGARWRGSRPDGAASRTRARAAKRSFVATWPLGSSSVYTDAIRFLPHGLQADYIHYVYRPL